MPKILFTFLLFLIFSLPAMSASRISPEKVYQAKWCNAHNGQLEYRLNDNSRVDCLTANYAVEIDFANKWAECIGQALYYGTQTKRQPACVLIMENYDKDLKYLNKLRRAAYKKGINLRTFTIKPNQI